MRSPMRFLAPALIVLSAAAPAAAQQNAQSGERLLVSPPPGWQAVPLQKSDKMVITRLYPPGQNEQSWSEIITVQIYPNSQQNARQFAESIVRFSRESCESVGAAPIAEKAVNGYPSASTTISCTKGKSSGQGGFLMLQTLQGKEALYAVQRQWRGPAFAAGSQPTFPADMLARWGAFSQNVGLCDTRDGQHPCP